MIILSLSIVQPIATLHNSDGTLKAIRVFKAKVEYRDVSSKIKGKTLVRFTDIDGIIIDKLLEQQVIDVSMEDLTQNKSIRSLVTCRPRSMELDPAATVRGAFAMSAIKADGTVLYPEMYQIIGSICYSDDNEAVRMQDIMYIDYMGTVYTMQQMHLKSKRVYETSLLLLRGVRVKSEEGNYTLFYQSDASWGIGNIAVGKNYPAACLAYKVIDYADASYIRAASATALCVNPARINSAVYSPMLARDVMHYNVYSDDISASALLNIPYGFESVAVKAPLVEHLRTVILPTGVLFFTANTYKAPCVQAKTPLLKYHVEATHADRVEIPLVQSVSGTSAYTQVYYDVEQVGYTDKPVSLWSNIYDVETADFIIGSQCSAEITVPSTRGTYFTMPITEKDTSIMLLPVQMKAMPPLGGKHITSMCLLLDTEHEHNILMKAQGHRKTMLVLHLTHKPEMLVGHKQLKPVTSKLDITSPAPKATTAYIALTEGIEVFNVTVADSVTLKVQNNNAISTDVYFVTSIWGKDNIVDEVEFTGDLTHLCIYPGTNSGATYIVRANKVKQLSIKLPMALQSYMHGKKPIKDMQNYLVHIAKLLHIYAKVDHENISIMDAHGLVIPRQFIELFIKYSVHDVGE